MPQIRPTVPQKRPKHEAPHGAQSRLASTGRIMLPALRPHNDRGSWLTRINPTEVTRGLGESAY